MALPLGYDFVADYGDVDGEAAACREDCALFDFSFVARARIAGTGAAALLTRFTGRPLGNLAPGRIAYALHARPDGTLLSDLTIWNLGNDSFEVMTGRPADLAELAALAEGLAFEDLSDGTTIFALQGPNSLRALQGLADLESLARLPYFGHCEVSLGGIACHIGRLGYTGERGFELLLPRAKADELWQHLSERARRAGFAAADRLRIEAGLPLFFNDFALPVRAAEAGLARFAAAEDPSPEIQFVCVRGTAAQQPLLWRPAKSLSRPRQAGDITVTSAGWSTLAGGVLALGYVLPPDAETGRRLTDPQGNFHGLEVASQPFYDPQKRRPRGGWSQHWRPV